MHCWCLFGVYHLSTEISRCFVVLWCFICKYVNNINVNNILDLGVREKKWNTLETFNKHTLTKTHLKLILEYMPILLTIALYVKSSVALLWCSWDILLVVYDSGNSTFALPCILKFVQQNLPMWCSRQTLIGSNFQAWSPKHAIVVVKRLLSCCG